LPAQADKFLAERKSMQAQLAEVARMREKAMAQKLLGSMQEIGSVQYASGVAKAAGMDELRQIADKTCENFEQGVAVISCVNDGKVNLVVKASKAAVKAGIHAGKIIREAAQLVGGGGGGRPDMAQAGGKDPEGLPKAFEKAAEVIKTQLGC